MGGGDLNMKKSWHPLLKTNQEKVWKQEKKALEERRKLDELRREREQERELQELQRLQEAAGGRKRSEKLDWMYATPSAGQGPSANELEDYLLGKKSVDKLLQQKDTPVASSSNTADQSSFMAVQNANSSRDMASKIRADPLLAIKQQEQAAYQALLKDPARLRQLQEANGVVTGESKEERRKRREEKRRAKEEKRAEKEGMRSSRHAERAAKLAAMQTAATTLSTTRTLQLAKIKQDEEAEAAREEAAKLRAKLRAGGGGGKKDGGAEWDEGGAKGSFLLAEQSKMFGVGAAGGQGMDLAERVKRGKGRLEKLADE
ncbi:unnamed protein product [Tilletia caries]|uniref:CBF1-interacting co-repressor CIR N-terminal domain-containing protein n=1 Tax=Tilletia caries TaxID=13290 RepID=A0ABN7IY62_9BASI|nr:unnamed protein product [Tilletia caries]CAD6929275.1 unnamed protein product [Tilletia caries]